MALTDTSCEVLHLEQLIDNGTLGSSNTLTCFRLMGVGTAVVKAVRGELGLQPPNRYTVSSIRGHPHSLHSQPAVAGAGYFARFRFWLVYGQFG